MQESMRAGDYEGWPPEVADPVLFKEFGDYYRAISKFFDFDPDDLDGFTRHAFFVGNAPYELDGKWLLSLSTLDRLLGLDYSPILPPSLRDRPSIESTEYEDLDAVIALNLLWKESAGPMMSQFSLQELIRIVEVAGDFLSQDGERSQQVKDLNLEQYSTEAKREVSPEEREWLDFLTQQQGFDIPEG